MGLPSALREARTPLWVIRAAPGRIRTPTEKDCTSKVGRLGCRCDRSRIVLYPIGDCFDHLVLDSEEAVIRAGIADTAFRRVASLEGKHFNLA